jgi:cytohesin
MEAASFNSAKIITMLINAGSDVNASNGDGMTPLMLAVIWNSSDRVAILLDAGADVNVWGTYAGGPPLTPLMFSAYYSGTPDCIKMLIDAGADVNAKDELGNTPLMLVVCLSNSNPFFPSGFSRR